MFKNLIMFAPDGVDSGGTSTTPTPTPAPTPTPTTPDAGAATPGNATPAPNADASEFEKLPVWAQQQFNRMYGKQKELERLASTAQELLEAQRRTAGGTSSGDTSSPTPSTSTPAPQPQRPALSEADVDARANVKAREIANGERLKEQETSMVTKGAQTYGAKWEGFVGTLRQLGGFDPQSWSQILASDNPHMVLAKLAQDPTLYQRVIDMPDAKRLAEIVKLGIGEAPKSQAPSNAPNPIEPITIRGENSGGTDIYDPKLSDDKYDATWFAARAEQKRKSVGRPWSPPGNK